MRELSVYYCPKCGFYGYYQLPKNAVCPKCSINLAPLYVSYQDFMNLDCKERDDLLATHIISSSSPYIQRLIAPHKTNNNREIIALLSQRIEVLEEENKALNATISWMHTTIWDLVHILKGIPPKQTVKHPLDS